MAKIHFAPHLQHLIACPAVEVAGDTVRNALEQAFFENPKLRGYIFDDQGRLRRHVNVFVDGKPVVDRVHLSDPVHDASEIFVLQALSGG